MTDVPPATTASPPRIPRSIWVLGFVSMFMDVSSEMIHALLPVYLVSVMGASALAVGFIEGVAEATANVTKVFSGVLSDWLGRRKLLAAIGYGLAACTKPIFPLATSLGWVVVARFLDRVGKGIRGAPRDALVADLAPPELRGASFGLRQGLDTIGAFAGPFAAILLMTLSGDDYRLVFWIAVIPAFASVALISLGVSEPERRARPGKAALRLGDVSLLPAAFWITTALACALTLARFSEAFLVLLAEPAGLPLALVPLVLVVMNIAYALSAYPAGVLSDRYGRKGVLVVGILLLVLADALLARAQSLPWLAAGIVAWGLHMGFTQGLLAALVADAAPERLRGTAFGLFNLASGLALLAASVIAGALWQAYGPPATFLAGAGFALVSLAGLLFAAPREASRSA